MISFRYVSDKIIYVERDGNKIATISDSCCATTIRFDKDTKYIELFFQSNSGGFLAKKKNINGEIVFPYRTKVLEVFDYCLKSEKIREYLKKSHIKLTKQHIEEGRHIEILRLFEK